MQALALCYPRKRCIDDRIVPSDDILGRQPHVYVWFDGRFGVTGLGVLKVPE